jgi:hypothetical protein
MAVNVLNRRGALAGIRDAGGVMLIGELQVSRSRWLRTVFCGALSAGLLAALFTFMQPISAHEGVGGVSDTYPQTAEPRQVDVTFT